MANPAQIVSLSLSMLAAIALGAPSLAAIEPPLPELAQMPEAEPSGQQQLHSEAGRFSVMAPLEVQVAPTTTTVEGNTLTWTIASASQGASFYGVAYTDLSLEALGLGQEAIVASLKQHPLVKEIDWQAIARGHRVSEGELSGLEYMYLEGDRVAAVRFYLANRRLYVVMASSPDLQAVHQFVESFAIDLLWQPFVSEPGRFTVELPMAPVASPQQVMYRGTPLNWWQFVGYNLYAPSDRYGFAYADLPDGVTPTSADALLSEVATQILTELEVPDLSTQGTVTSFNGSPGRQYMLTQNGKSSVLRLYLVDRRIYGLLATSQSLSNLDRFLSSFQVQ